MMTRMRDWMVEIGEFMMIEDMRTFITLLYISGLEECVFFIIKCDFMIRYRVPDGLI